jgi:Cys-rich protein (TIGR04453 family)
MFELIQRKLITILISIFFISVFNFTIQAEPNCPQACDKFITCTEEINQTKANVQQKATLSKGCSESCKKHQEKILECFDKSNQEGGSCGVYSACVMKYAQMMKSTKK